jgi:uncharacterized protein
MLLKDVAMPLSPDQLRDNPWWGDPRAIGGDPQLRELARAPLVFRPDIPFDLEVDAVYALRGPRQVGKTTLLKRVVEERLGDGVPARTVMYLDVEGANIRTAHELQEAVRMYLEWVRSSYPEQRCTILLDEITGVESWGTAIRVLHGRGDLEGCTVVCTGSHARDVKRGAERAPGRKGVVEAWDWVLMPLCFRDYVALQAPEVAARLPTFDPTTPGDAYAAVQEIELHQRTLHPLFDRYLVTGGYPHAVSAEAAEGRIPPRVYRLYQEAFRGEVVRAGHREDLFRELVSWISASHLGSEFNWSDGSGGTAIGSHHTVREYLEDAQAAFLWHVLYRVKSLDSPVHAPRSPKKLYPVDPLTWHVLKGWVAGSRDPWGEAVMSLGDPQGLGVMVEAVVGDHLRRWRGPFTLYHRAAQGDEEIDFVTFTGTDRALIEVKYRNTIKGRDSKTLRKYGGGLLVTRKDLFMDEDNRVAALPAPSFLAGLPAPLTLFPAVE